MNLELLAERINGLKVAIEKKTEELKVYASQWQLTLSQLQQLQGHLDESEYWQKEGLNNDKIDDEKPVEDSE